MKTLTNATGPRWQMTFLALIGVAIPMAPLASGQVVPGDTRQHGQIMERKLDAVQKVMEGIARSDFELIAKESQKLHLLSREAGWNVLLTPTYLRLSEDFRATAKQLEKSAKAENLDAAGLSYVKLSISCIECHRYAKKEMPRIGAVPLKRAIAPPEVVAFNLKSTDSPPVVAKASVNPKPTAVRSADIKLTP